MSEEETLLMPSDEYLKSGIHIGTKFKTKYMEKFIYKTRPDGLSVFNLQKVDERIRLAVNLLAQYDPKDILIVSRRENAWKSLIQFKKLTGVNIFAERYPPGIMTNPQLKNYKEVGIVLVVDIWADRNAINDANTVGIPVIALCDTNNTANKIDLVLPCNNKGKKSLGTLFYLLTKEYMKKRNMIKNDEEFPAKLSDFVEE